MNQRKVKKDIRRLHKTFIAGNISETARTLKFINLRNSCCHIEYKAGSRYTRYKCKRTTDFCSIITCPYTQNNQVKPRAVRKK